MKEGRDGSRPNTPAKRALAAIMLGDHAGLEEVLTTHREIATGQGWSPSGMPVTPLGVATGQGDSLAVKMLLDRGADPHKRATGSVFPEPMTRAIEARSLACVNLLLRCAAWGDQAPGAEHDDWADLAVRYQRDENAEPPMVLRALLGQGTRATQRAVVRAVGDGKHEAATLLLESGADADGADEGSGIVPLASCVALDQAQNVGPRMLELLMAHGASTSAWCGPTETRRPPALVAAVEAGQRWAVRELLARGTDQETARDYIRSHGIREMGAEPQKVREALEALI